MIKVYIKTDDKNRIVDINSDIFIEDFTDWIEIDEGEGDKYAHAQGMYFEKPLIESDGTHNYMYVDGKTREATEEEHEAEKKEIPVVEETSPMSDVWNDHTIYEVNTLVLYNNSMYKCLVKCGGIIPTDERFWNKTTIANELNAIAEERSK